MTLSLRATGLRYEYEADTVPFVLDVSSLEFVSGRVHFICGPSGSGKSTLALLLAGLTQPSRGLILLGMEPIHQCSSKVAYVFQFPETLFVEDSVEDELITACGSRDLRAASDLFATIGLDLESLRAKHPFHLSASEGRMTAILMQMLRSPQVLILDEPSIGLDWVFHRKLIRLLQAWFTKERILLIITHDLRLLEALDGTVSVLGNGLMRWNGEVNDLLRDETRLRQFGLI